MKFLFFSSDNNSGSGAFRALVKLVSEIRSKDKNNEVFVVLPYQGSGTKMLKEAKIPYKVIFSFSWIKHDYFNPIDYLLYPINKVTNLVSYQRIKKVMLSYHPDLVIINTSYHYISAKVALNLKIPYVWHIREFLNEDQNKTYYSTKYALNLYNHAKHVICVSEGVMNKYKGKINDEILTYVYDGIDVNSFYKEDREIFKENKIHFLNVGRIKTKKGQYLIVKALNELATFDFDLTFVGYIHLLDKIKLLKFGKNIKNRIKFVGQVKNPKSYYEKGDVFIMSSISEAFGLVTVEAMLEGLCVVASNSLGSAEIVQSEEYGYLFNKADYKDLKEQLIKIFNNKNEAIQRAKKGNERALNTFSSKLNSDKIFEIYKSSVSK